MLTKYCNDIVNIMILLTKYHYCNTRKAIKTKDVAKEYSMCQCKTMNLEATIATLHCDGRSNLVKTHVFVN